MVRSEPYLPKWATLDEAVAWLEGITGENWPLPRILESMPIPAVWFEPNGVDDPLFETLFDGRLEGCLFPLMYHGDLVRLQIDRTGLLTMTRHPSSDLPVRFNIGLPFDLTDLRFRAADLRRALEVFRSSAPTSHERRKLKRKALIDELEKQWPKIGSSLSRSASNGLNDAAKLGDGFWDVDAAIEWAKERGQWLDRSGGVLSSSPFGKT